MNVFNMSKTDARNMDKWMMEVALPMAVYYYFLFCYYLLIYPVVQVVKFFYNIDKHVNRLCDVFDKPANDNLIIFSTPEDAPDNRMTLGQFCHTFIVTPLYNLLPKRVETVVVEDTKKIKELVAFNARMLDELMKAERIAEKAVELAERTSERADRAELLIELAVAAVNELKSNEGKLIRHVETLVIENEELLAQVEEQQAIIEEINNTVAPVEEVIAPNVVEVEAPVMDDEIPNVFVRTEKVKGKWKHRPARKSDKAGKELYKPNPKGSGMKKLTLKELDALAV